MVRVAVAAAPRAAAPWSFKVPEFNVTPPEKVFAPVNHKVPAPFLVRLLAVAPLEMTPPSVRVPALTVIVRVVPDPPRATAPVPIFRSCVVPLAPVKA